MNLNRDEAIALLKEHNKDEGHIKHGLAVEACMRYFAVKAGSDENLWGITGLLHDLDWEEVAENNPEKHTHVTAEILRDKQYPEALIRAIQAHSWGITSDVEPLSDMEKTLFTIDELTGLVMTTALVRPSKSLMDLTPKSVKKKWKDKRFAAGVDRDLIEKGASMMGIELQDLIKDVIEAMRPVEADLGLGTAQ